jgi:hypothetical protein
MRTLKRKDPIPVENGCFDLLIAMLIVGLVTSIVTCNKNERLNQRIDELEMQLDDSSHVKLMDHLWAQID